MASKRPREDSISSLMSPQAGIAAHTPKYTELDEDEPGQQPAKPAMQCSLPPHEPLNFSDYSSYERHYTESHANRCTECRRNFPSTHFLDLHLAENHDPIIAAKRDMGEKCYACFVEDCDKICLEWKKRRSHLIDKHGFPKNYDFLIVNSGIDGRRNMLRPGIDAQGHRKSSRERRGSSATEVTQTTDATSMSLHDQEQVPSEDSKMEAAKCTPSDAVNTNIDQITKSMSALQFVPRSVTFGKRKGKSGFARS